MVSNSQLKRVPGLQKAYQFARAKLHPHGYEMWLRVVMNQETARLVRELDFKHASVLEISGLAWKDFGFARYVSVGYPEYDVCAGVLEEKFDIIIAEQVFEHVLWPYRAVRNVFQMLNSSGAFLVTTPFLVRIHGHPIAGSGWRKRGMGISLRRGDSTSIESPPDHGVIGHACARICSGGRLTTAGCTRLGMKRTIRCRCGRWRGNKRSPRLGAPPFRGPRASG